MSRDPNHSAADAEGFTLVELMIVVAILGVLVAVAFPVYYASVANVRRKTCFAQQRTIESAVSLWNASGAVSASGLTGVVDAAHPLIADGFLKRAPRCPSAPVPANLENPDASTGAYTLDATELVEGCAFGALGVHGSYR